MDHRFVFEEMGWLAGKEEEEVKETKRIKRGAEQNNPKVTAKTFRTI